jgi:tryptophanyl-tRNA synthetase
MRILTGIQPSGKPHIGNYFGAMRQIVEIQKKGETFVFLADYHSLTTSPEPKQLRVNVLELALNFLACGVNTQDTTLLFRQSDVPEVCELTWILNNVTPVGLLERAHSYKDKIAKGFAPSNGLFSYPVLMAADILLYQSNLVPVGKDQKQHLEITRDIAIKFNNQYGEVFTIPDGLIPEEVAIVPGTDGQKMSKSYNNTIPIFGSEKEIKKAIMNVVTDCKGLEEPKDPEHCNVVALYKLVAAPEELEAMKANYRAGNYGYGHAKLALFDRLWSYFEPMRKRRTELEQNLDYVWQVLREGAEKARIEADKTMAKVRQAVGLR